MRTTSTLNGVQIPNAALAAEKRNGIANTQKSIRYGEARLAKANRLTKDLPAIRQEMEALEKTSPGGMRPELYHLQAGLEADNSGDPKSGKAARHIIVEIEGLIY